MALRIILCTDFAFSVTVRSMAGLCVLQPLFLHKCLNSTKCQHANPQGYGGGGGGYGRDMGWRSPGLQIATLCFGAHLPHLPHTPRVPKHCYGGNTAVLHYWPTYNQLCSCKLPSRKPLMLVQCRSDDYAQSGDGGRANQNMAVVFNTDR